jgi:hypothetical protein
VTGSGTMDPSPLLDVMRPAYAPCENFRGVCSQMRWSPSEGHVPRGFCGALGTVAEVNLVLVTAEPGDPLPGEAHTSIESTVEYSLRGLREGVTPFHRNICLILNLCFPNQSLDEQLRRTWRTNSVLCSAKVECGPVPRVVESACMRRYLAPQLALLPHALVAALGGKAQKRLGREGIACFSALHPSSRKSNAEKLASWRALAAELHRRADV